VQGLALDAVADLRIDRIGAHLERHRATEAPSTVFRDERRLVRVRRKVLPALLLGRHGFGAYHDGPERGAV
jgi:hypothetical protein